MESKMNPDKVEPELKMFSVSICVSVEAEDEEGAVNEFCVKMKNSDFDCKSIEIEEDNFE